MSLDSTGFEPLDLTTDATPDLTAGVGGLPPELPGTGGGGAGNLLGKLTGNTTALALIDLLIPIIGIVVYEAGLDKPPKWLSAILSPVDQAEEMLAVGQGKSVWKWFSQLSGYAFIRPMLEEGIGVTLPPKGSQADKTISTIDTMISFAIGIEFVITAVQHVGKAILGNRWPETLQLTLGKIPEAMGLSWALGLIIDRAFEAAFGEGLNNYIRAKTRPNEPEWQIARMMLRQHVISDEQLTTILQNAGYPEEWITAIKTLEFQPLPVGDVQGMYQQGIIEETDIDPMLLQLGFSDRNRDLIKQFYVTKAETAAGAEQRSVWRTLFRNGYVTEADYRQKLADLNFPQRLVDGDVQAVLDEKQYGWRVANVATVKSDYLHNPGSQTVAISKLQQLGMSNADATDLVNSWTALPIPRKHGLTQAQVLKYFVAQLLDEPTTRKDLMTLGVQADAIDFLIKNAPIAAGTHIVRLTPGLVIQAYLNGAIQQSDLMAALNKAGAKDQVATFYYDQAITKYAHHHEAGSGQQPLSEAQILSLYKYSIWDAPTAQTALRTFGYSSENAWLLLEIENKGPIKPAQPPAFGSVQAAYDYLLLLGLQISEPVDPVFESALTMVEQAGYVVTYPPNFHQPTAPPIFPAPPPGTNPPPATIP